MACFTTDSWAEIEGALLAFSSPQHYCVIRKAVSGVRNLPAPDQKAYAENFRGLAQAIPHDTGVDLDFGNVYVESFKEGNDPLQFVFHVSDCGVRKGGLECHPPQPINVKE